jgi:hypothetical protein
LPLLDDAGPFWLLTISASGARFFQGSRWNFAEVPEVDLPLTGPFHLGKVG